MDVTRKERRLNWILTCLRYSLKLLKTGTWNDLIAKGLDAIKAQGAGGPSMGGGGYGGQFGANAPISAAAGVAPTNVLQLSNMVTPQELSDDSEHADILEDVKQEMGKFGIVGRVEIPRTGAGAGQIYVAFGQMGDALKCINGMRGRTFGGNTVAAHFYPENMFLQNKFVDISLPGAAAVVPLAAVPVMQQQQQYAPPMQPPMQPPAGGGFAPPMAAQGGRGRCVPHACGEWWRFGSCIMDACLTLSQLAHTSSLSASHPHPLSLLLFLSLSLSLSLYSRRCRAATMPAWMTKS